MELVGTENFTENTIIGRELGFLCKNSRVYSSTTSIVGLPFFLLGYILGKMKIIIVGMEYIARAFWNWWELRILQRILS